MSSDPAALALLAAFALGLVAIEPGPSRSRELALVAALAAAAAGGRVLLAAIPNVQPVTMIVAGARGNPGAPAGPPPRAAAGPGPDPVFRPGAGGPRAEGRRGPPRPAGGGGRA